MYICIYIYMYYIYGPSMTQSMIQCFHMFSSMMNFQTMAQFCPRSECCRNFSLPRTAPWHFIDPPRRGLSRRQPWTTLLPWSFRNKLTTGNRYQQQTTGNLLGILGYGKLLLHEQRLCKPETTDASLGRFVSVVNGP